MDLALYHPQYGYYASSSAQMGAAGDFFTSCHLSADFGELLAEQFVQMWELLKQPKPFTLVEMGAGQGLLAMDVLTALQHNHPNCFACLEYVIIERAAALIQVQQHQLQQFLAAGVLINWCDFADIPDSITGCFFSNELVDALSVHQVVLEAGQLREIYISVNQQDSQTHFVEVVGDLSTSQLVDYFDVVGIDLRSPPYPDGYRTEVNLAALDWMTTVATHLERGYVLTIDYGYPSDRYYHPARTGTLQCYFQHQHHSDPYRNVGQQDITAHVNFTALEKQGELHGLKCVGYTKQALFLMALGLGDRLMALSQSSATDAQSIQEVLRRRDALHSLINPIGLGDFGVLIQSKGVESTVPLMGLMGEIANA
ncbi:class I SAM-dependent methyltransferase [Phormidium sp. CLA17]|nr:class I SAM-dependent methyltransferase [Leptolyngbya sp. Cla-17]